MKRTLSRKLIDDHLVSGNPQPGEEIALRIDQALLQDVLGSLVMLELEAMGVERVVTSPSVQYVDHALVQADGINAEAHLFLERACQRLGVIYSGPGNGISHPVHMEYFGRPGETLAGCDSHTTAAGALGMLAIGAGGIEIAQAMAGEPLYITMPEVMGVYLEGTLPDWVSARDVVLELLRRHGVAGAKDCILEYYGPGLAGLSAMDRHVMANMGTEMGATSSVFPSDEAVRTFLKARGREADFRALAADDGCRYDRHERIDLSMLEPLIARPSSPDNVVPVREAAGEPLYQAYIGSSGCPGYRDFAITADIVRGQMVAPGVSLDINPSSRQVLATLTREGYLGDLIQAGARLHQAGCNGCIGMGQAPAAGRNSLRTVPRNFPGRSGTREDSVFLCSAETAAASALTGVITDPRTLGRPAPRIEEPGEMVVDPRMFVTPPEVGVTRPVMLATTHTPALPEMAALSARIEAPVLLRVGDNISTDDIMPAGNRVLPLWSDVPASAAFTFEAVDSGYAERAGAGSSGHVIVAGHNYGQGSSRENAALVPRYLGLEVVIAKSFARIHWQNLVSFGVLPLTVSDDADHQRLMDSRAVTIESPGEQIERGTTVEAYLSDGTTVTLEHQLSERQRDILRAGGVINHLKMKQEETRV
ncbi:aconitate hydratase [Kushneria marisflavi]|uniref:Aconitate hydratase n=1 Tax=Kushneria marisflavi TaxID=157779 RepID=A0A240UPS6_9GAMM|nr:aconitate hydratase [Kushneria marisflavi]ART63020.1 aconitate hydratase [Kushneria marisflavi]RKD84738.1 aconitase [Kushneria marisflavi]